MEKEFIKNFKDGVADAILNGNMAEIYKNLREYSDGYKQGYDFGITIFCELEEQGEWK
tara:strand:+ start:1370 stop:1543 length:174 start_codon:yes stop_codon:yes gene_type:complete